MSLPFQNADKAGTQSLNASIEDDGVRNEFEARVKWASKEFLGGVTTKPQKSAALIYVGVCYLAHLYRHKQFDEAREICEKVYLKIQPDVKGSKGVNCSYFDGTVHKSADQFEKIKFRTHKDVIEDSTNVFAPNATSMKKRCAVLLSIGTKYIEHFRIDGNKGKLAKIDWPVDDSWIEKFSWRPPAAEPGDIDGK